MNRKVIVAVDDMLFSSKIRAAAEHLETSLRFARTAESVISQALSDTPDLIIVDLQSQGIDPIHLANEIRRDQQLSEIPLLGFFSHIQVELQRSAVEAGFTKVVPRSVFSRDLGQILTDKTY